VGRALVASSRLDQGKQDRKYTAATSGIGEAVACMSPTNRAFDESAL